MTSRTSATSRSLEITDLHMSGTTALWVNALDFAGGTAPLVSQALRRW